MTADTSESTFDAALPQGRVLTDEEDRQMKEHLYQEIFGMSLEKFTAAWQHGKHRDRLISSLST